MVRTLWMTESRLKACIPGLRASQGEDSNLGVSRPGHSLLEDRGTCGPLPREAPGSAPVPQPRSHHCFPFLQTEQWPWACPSESRPRPALRPALPRPAWPRPTGSLSQSPHDSEMGMSLPGLPGPLETSGPASCRAGEPARTQGPARLGRFIQAAQSALGQDSPEARGIKRD